MHSRLTNGTAQKPSRSRLNGRVCEHLLRAGARPGSIPGARALAADLDVPYSTVTAHLRQLLDAGQVHTSYLVNPFRTRFCHEFHIGLRLDAHHIKRRFDDALRHPVTGEHDLARRAGGPIEWYLAGLIGVLPNHGWLVTHLIVTDATILHGAPGRDVELTVLTDDGIYSAGRYVREVLVADPSVLEAMTHTVAWRYSFEGYSGQHANGDVRTDDARRGPASKPGRHRA